MCRNSFCILSTMLVASAKYNETWSSLLHVQEIVHEVAWDLLSMMSPHLTSPDSRTASLISHIAEVNDLFWKSKR